MAPIDSLPGAMQVLQRDETRDKYLRDYRLRNPSGDTRENTQPYVDASVIADALVPLYGDAVTIGNFVSARNKAGEELRREAQRFGTDYLPPAGATGFVIVDASVGGGTILSGDELKDPNTGLRFTCTATALYQAGSYVPISGTDTGPSTNLPPGTLLQWTVPRPGINPVATVATQADGSGLSGGRNLETDAELDLRLVELRANPAAAGNNAEFVDATTATPGIAIQAAFAYPAINGSGTTGIAFLLRPASPGGNRIPNAAQIADVNAWLVGQFPADDSIVVCTIVAVPVTVALKTTWSANVSGWADLSPWPAFSSPLVTVDSTPAPTATTFRLTTTASVGAPVAGQTIAFYDQPNATFRRKRVLSVTDATGGGIYRWDIVCDTTFGVSDTSYTPVVGQTCCPWSDSLQSIVPDVVAYFDTLGPGEQVASIPDPQLRQRRWPRSPQKWPSAITNRMIAALFTLTSLDDVDLYLPAIPDQTPVGIQGVSSNLFELGSLVAFP